MTTNVYWKTDTPPVCLNLDKEFCPSDIDGVLDHLNYDELLFHGGEQNIRITTEVQYPGKLIITQRYNSPEDLVAILLANDAAKRMGYTDIELVLPYFPGARQDRVCNPGEPLTVKVFADMINSCGFSKVTILCPHSEVTPALLNNVHILNEYKFVERIISELHDFGDGFYEFNIVCPDAGAGKRVMSVTKHLASLFPKLTFNLIRCEKVRDVLTGDLKEFVVQAEDLEGIPSIIIDDINCMGGTFLGLRQELIKKNSGETVLYTTHSDCVKGIKNVCSAFWKVYTTNSKRNYTDLVDNDNFTCYSV